MPSFETECEGVSAGVLSEILPPVKRHRGEPGHSAVAPVVASVV